MQVWQQHGEASRFPDAAKDTHLALVYGPREALSPEALRAVQAACPDAQVVGCSGAGEILGTELFEDDLVVTGVRFDRARAHAVSIELQDDEGSDEAGRRLMEALPQEGLRHVLVFSDGLHVNGTALVDGMQGALPPGVAITGGLAGDGDRFEKTLVAHGDQVGEGRLAAVGLYGVKVGYGSLGGWDAFGPRRKVTRSKQNVLYELDGRPALDLYKEYLGKHAEDLPSTALLFPLFLPKPGQDGVVRTVLGVDEAEASMTFAGDIPEGATVQLMKANFDRLIDGAEGAAKRSGAGLDGEAELALLISCVGRKLVLKQRVEDELDAVRQVVGPQAAMAGFYSYGEICPMAPGADCRLHNQTMTVTTLRED